MLEETGEWCVERTVASPQLRPWKDTLATEFLDQSALGKDDAQDVAECREGNEDGEGALGSGPEDVAEERRGDKALRGDNFLGGNGGEVGNVDQHVQDRNGA